MKLLSILFLALLVLPAALPSASAACPNTASSTAISAGGDTFYVYAGTGDGPGGQEVGIYRESNNIPGLQRPTDTCGGQVDADETIFA